MGYPLITSRKNPLVREAAQLGASAQARQGRRRFLCEGARLCQDAARSGVGIDTCFFTASTFSAWISPSESRTYPECVKSHFSERLSIFFALSAGTASCFVTSLWWGTEITLFTALE